MGGSIIKIFSLIELNDLWSKKICWPQMIVWSVATFILRWSCYKYILILTGKPLYPATTSMTLLTRLTRLKRQHAKFWSRQDLQENFVQELKHNHIMNMSNYLVLLSIFLLFSIKHILTQWHYYRKIQTIHFSDPKEIKSVTAYNYINCMSNKFILVQTSSYCPYFYSFYQTLCTASEWSMLSFSRIFRDKGDVAIIGNSNSQDDENARTSKRAVT